MAIQDLFNDVKTRVDSARKQTQDALKAYRDASKKAVNVVTDNARDLAKTETEAAKDIYAAAKASFDKARKDGVRQVASKPTEYVPASRERIVSAYKETIDLLVKTGNELSDVVSKGYKSVLDKLNGGKKPAKKPAARKTAAKRSTSAKSGSNAKSATSTAKKSSSSKGGSKSTTRKSASTTAQSAS